MIIALIPLRVYVLPGIFERRELKVLDALTADSEVVLASLGGRPVLREDRRFVDDDHEDADGENGIEAAESREKEHQRRRKVEQEGDDKTTPLESSSAGNSNDNVHDNGGSVNGRGTGTEDIEKGENVSSNATRTLRERK